MYMRNLKKHHADAFSDAFYCDTNNDLIVCEKDLHVLFHIPNNSIIDIHVTKEPIDPESRLVFFHRCFGTAWLYRRKEHGDTSALTWVVARKLSRFFSHGEISPSAYVTIYIVEKT